MEKPSSLQPQIAERQTRLRAIQREVGDLRPEQQRVTERREEFVSKIRREYLTHHGLCMVTSWYMYANMYMYMYNVVAGILCAMYMYVLCVSVELL